MSEISSSAVVLMAASCFELAPVLRRLGVTVGRYDGEFTFHGTQVFFAVTGVGGNRAGSAARALMDRHQVSHLIFCGLAGALDRRLRVADPVIPRWIVKPEGLCANLAGNTPQLGPDDRSRNADQTLLCVDHLVQSVEEKRALFQQCRASAVDMESFAVAQAAVERGVSLTIIRAISDPAELALPPHADRWIDPQGCTVMSYVLRDLVAAPWRLPTLWRLQRASRRALARVAADVEDLLYHLVEGSTSVNQP